MGRKKKRVLKPWCWYCNRDFEEEKVLIYHQRSKHFRCKYCSKKLYTAPGLVIHSLQVHKEAISCVPNSLPHRSNIELEIYGVNGIPEADVKARELSFIESLKNPQSNVQQKPSVSHSAAGNNSSGNSSDNNSPNPYISMSLLNTELDFSAFNQIDDEKIKPPEDDEFLVPVPPVHTYPYAAILNKYERKYIAEFNAPVKKPQRPDYEDDKNVKIILSTNDFKPLKTKIKDRAKIYHPPYDVSLEEYRLSQRPYRLSVTSKDVMKSYLDMNGIRPQTVPFGHMNPISALNKPGILKNPPSATQNLFY